MQKIAEEFSGEVVPFDARGASDVQNVTIPGARIMREANIVRPALECDKIIPLPVMKTSMEGGGVTLCIKVLHALTDPYTTRLMYHRTDIHQKLVDIMHLVRPKIKLAVIDGLLAMEGDGPVHGNPVDMGVIIAGDDPISVDAVGSMTMGFRDPFEIGPIAAAHQQGLGVADPDRIEVLGTQIKDVMKPFKRATFQVEGLFPNVAMLEGGTCTGCKAWIKFTLYPLKGHGVLEKEVPDKVGKLLFIAGLNPYLPASLDALRKEGLPLIFGDCAIVSMIQQGRKGLLENDIVIPGCPPFAVKEQMIKIKRALGLPEVTQWDSEFIAT